MWTAFTIGAGKLVRWNDILFCPQEATCLGEEKSFFAISAREISPSPVLKLKNSLVVQSWKLIEVKLQITAP